MQRRLESQRTMEMQLLRESELLTRLRRPAGAAQYQKFWGLWEGAFFKTPLPPAPVHIDACVIREVVK